MRRAYTKMMVAGAVAAAALAVTQPASAARETYAIPLPGATGAEGIARGSGTTFYAGDLVGGGIYRGDIRAGNVETLVPNGQGRSAVGLKADVANKLLFVAGGPTGQAYAYDTRTGATVATFQLTTAGFINDVTLTKDGAWFTDSLNPRLYFVPVAKGVPQPPQTLALSGPAADTSGAFNNNGIAATADGSALLVAHSGRRAVNLVDPVTGGSQAIAGVDVPNVDGILLQGRTLYVVQNRLNQIAKVELSGDLTRGTVAATATSDLFRVPTTVALFGDGLAAVNAQFGLPIGDGFEVVVVDRP